jgi:DNA-binding IclR family transcriptional regulator
MGERDPKLQGLAETPTAVEGVKSADRVLALLEQFRMWRRPASAREIADALEMPRSSTNVLLRSMIQGGYLRNANDQNLYFPTLKVFQLGSWLIEGHVSDTLLDEAIRKLAADTQETVCCWIRVGFSVRVFKVCPSPQAIALTVEPGSTAPLFGSAAGLAFLMQMSDAEIAALIDAHNSAAVASRRAVRATVLPEVQAARERGVSVGYGRWAPDAAALVAPIDQTVIGEPLALAVGGPAFRVERNEAALEQALLACAAVLRASGMAQGWAA